MLFLGFMQMISSHPEKEVCIDKTKLMRISGRSRKIKISLAGEKEDVEAAA
jgi:hypothetical protein